MVDAAAKAAASQEGVCAAARYTLSQALDAAEFGAAMTGVTTYAANNLKCEVVTATGQTTVVTRRDSTAANGPRTQRRQASVANSASASAPLELDRYGYQPCLVH